MTTQRTGKGPADRFRHESVTESVGRGLKRPWTARLSALVLAFAVLGASGPADSPVADAAERGDLEAVRALLRNGADVNTAQSDGMTALHWAASRNDAEIARALLYAGATVRATTRLGGYTPLHLASRAGSPEVAKQILEAGADPNVYTSTGVSAMHFAADADAPGVVALLAAHGAEVDARDTFSERTPLMFASVRGADAALAALLAAGADPALTTALKDYPAISTAWRAEQQQRRRGAGRRGRARRGGGGRGAARPGSAGADPAGSAPHPRPASPRGGECGQPRRPGGHPTRFSARAPTRAPPSGPSARSSRSASRAASRHSTTRPARVTAPPPRCWPTPGQTSTSRPAATRPPRCWWRSSTATTTWRGTCWSAAPTPTWSATTAPPRYSPPSTSSGRSGPGTPQPQAFRQQETHYLDFMRLLLEAGRRSEPADRHPHLVRGVQRGPHGRRLHRGPRPSGARPTPSTWTPCGSWSSTERTRTSGRSSCRGRRFFGVNVPAQQQEERLDPSGLPPVPDGGPAIHPLHAASGVGFGTSRVAQQHRSVPDGWLPAVRYLVDELGIDPNLRDKDGFTAIHHAAARGDNATILFLVSRGAT